MAGEQRNVLLWEHRRVTGWFLECYWICWNYICCKYKGVKCKLHSKPEGTESTAGLKWLIKGSLNKTTSSVPLEAMAWSQQVECGVRPLPGPQSWPLWTLGFSLIIQFPQIPIQSPTQITIHSLPKMKKLKWRPPSTWWQWCWPLWEKQENLCEHVKDALLWLGF